MRDRLACLIGAIYATALLTAMSGCIIIDPGDGWDDDYEEPSHDNGDLAVSNNNFLTDLIHLEQEAHDLAGRMIANGFSGTINIHGNDEVADCEE